MKKWYEIKNAADPVAAEILIYEDIGMWGIGAEQFVRDLKTVSAPTINVRINSYGGEVFDAFAIFNALKQHGARVITHNDGIAASAASMILMAGSEVRSAKNAFMMIHNPSAILFGESDELRSEADLLDKLRDAIAAAYADKSGVAVDQIVAWMDQTTWFTAEEAAAHGFIDTITDASDKAPEKQPTNYIPKILNSAGPRVRAADRCKALGLDALLTPLPSNKEVQVTKEQFIEFAAKNPDAAKELPIVKDAIESAREDGKKTGRAEIPKPKNATAAELKAAFPNDRDFVMDRLDADAPVAEHKIAFADHLAKKLDVLAKERDTAVNRLAEIDPAQAGTHPANTKTESTGGDDKPMSAERERELLNMSPLGMTIGRK